MCDYAVARCGSVPLPNKTIVDDDNELIDNDALLSTPITSASSFQAMKQQRELIIENLSVCMMEQEVCYNIGRGFHHLDIGFMAIVWYERVLSLRRKALKLYTLIQEFSVSITKYTSTYSHMTSNNVSRTFSGHTSSSKKNKNSSASHNNHGGASGGGENNFISGKDEGEVQVRVETILNDQSVHLEAAFNLSLIYKETGSEELAIELTRAYFPII